MPVALAGTASVGLTLRHPNTCSPPSQGVHVGVAFKLKHPETLEEGGPEPPCAPAQGWGVCQGVPRQCREVWRQCQWLIVNKVMQGKIPTTW